MEEEKKGWKLKHLRKSAIKVYGDKTIKTNLRISVVMIRHGDSGLIWTSPVSNPTSGKVLRKSRNFWLDNALIGEV